jgi:hypothetical protein
VKPPFKSQDELVDLGPEVKSYIYQTILEFQPYSTPQTVVAVVAKNPMRLYKSLQEAGDEISKEKLKKMWRICISLHEDGSKVEHEGVHEDIMHAIRIAKENLLKLLVELQDEAISNSDRTQQINVARQNTQIH